MDEIDRVLTDEPVIRPSSDFTARVMLQVHDAAATPAPIEFPWQRFLPGFFTAVALMFATFMVLGWSTDLSAAPEASAQWLAALDSPITRGLIIAALALAGSLATAWYFARPRAQHTGSF